MATAIEYGLIAALVSVAGITAMSNLGSVETPVVESASCSVRIYAEDGTIHLNCPGIEGARLVASDSRLALQHTLYPSRQLVCTLYATKHAQCDLAR